jgi:hypothetical protein
MGWVLLSDDCCGVVGAAYLEAEDLRLDEGEGLAVDLDETLALLLFWLAVFRLKIRVHVQ